MPDESDVLLNNRLMFAIILCTFVGYNMEEAISGHK